MTTQEKDQICDTLVEKMTSGTPLDDVEKSHLAGCDPCMSQILKALDEADMSESRIPSRAAGASNGDLSHLRPEAKKALEHGRKVFEREFGLSPSTK